jgi:hypothetical protein
MATAIRANSAHSAYVDSPYYVLPGPVSAACFGSVAAGKPSHQATTSIARRRLPQDGAPNALARRALSSSSACSGACVGQPRNCVSAMSASARIQSSRSLRHGR